MNPFFSALSLAYIGGIFLLADSPMVFSAPTFNPYSILHIPLYGILTILLILSFPPFQTNPDKQSDLFRFQIAGLIALVVAIADEIHQAYNPSRNASITDVLLDFIGIILCILLIRRIQRNEKIPSSQNDRASGSLSTR
jgi:VanZ family protein